MYQQPPPQYPYPQQPYQPPPHDPVKAAATRALILSIIAVPLCCAPLGIAGALFGMQAMKLAKARGSASPGRAVAAVVLGVISILAMVGGGIGFYLDQKQRQERLEAAEAATKGKLESDTLDKKVACALIEKQLIKGLYNGSQTVDHVTCGGKWDTDDKLGTMHFVEAEIVGDKKSFNVCLARARRWFVLSIAEGGGKCPTEPIEAKKGGATDAELDAEEDELRKGAKSRADKSTIDQLEATLIKVRKAVDGREHAAKKCSKLEGDKKVVPTVDFEFLKDPHTTKDNWSFLTSESIRHALDDKKPLEERAKLVREMSAPYLIVYSADEREWPETIKSKGVLGKKGFASGGMNGWMMVTDTRDASVVCEAELDFENSKSVGVGKWAGDKSVAEALHADLQKNYEAAAGKTLRDLTDSKLRLGFSPLD